MPKVQSLDRYDILKNFNLDDDKYIVNSTFLNEDNKICELLCANGFIKARPKIERITITAVPTAPYKKNRYLGQMNKTELFDIAEEEGVDLYKVPPGVDISTPDKFDKYWRIPFIIKAIQDKRGKRYVNGRLTRVRGNETPAIR